MNEHRTEGYPHNEFTQIADELLGFADLIESCQGKRILVIVCTDEEAGIGMRGYTSDSDAIIDAISAAQAVANLNGVNIGIAMIDRGGR